MGEVRGAMTCAAADAAQRSGSNILFLLFSMPAAGRRDKQNLNPGLGICNVLWQNAFDNPGLDVTCFSFVCCNLPRARNHLAKAAGSFAHYSIIQQRRYAVCLQFQCFAFT